MKKQKKQWKKKLYILYDDIVSEIYRDEDLILIFVYY